MRVLLLLSGQGCQQAQVSYRHIFFHVEVIVCIVVFGVRYERDIARQERQNEERKIKTEEK